MKKIILIIAIMLLVILSISLTACDTGKSNKSDETIIYSEGLAYSVNTGGETCTITGTGTCIDAEISIPEEIDGYTVTAIAPFAFYNNSGITAVLIPNGVTSIGDKAFYNCSSLTSITIPDSVITIGEEAFSGCLNIVEATISIIAVKHIPKDNLKTLVITSGTTIGASAFSNCTKLTRVTIPDSVTTIGQYAFYGCSSLTRMTIPDSVTTIGQYAFSGCDSLTSIIIPDSVTSIGIGAFGGCESLTSITLPFVGATKDGEGGTHFGYIFGADTNDYNSICVPDSLKEVVITGGTIGSYAFSGCRSLTSVTIGNSVTYIGRWAFDNCRNLTNVIFKDPNGWYVIDSHDVAEERTRVTLTNKTKNATYLTSTYGRYYWYKY